MNPKTLLPLGGGRPINQFLSKSLQKQLRHSSCDSSNGIDNNLKNNGSSDPLFYGRVSMRSSDLPPLTSGREIFDILEKKAIAKRLIDAPIRGPKESVEFFQRVFPEVTEWNQVGKYCASNANWNK